MTYTEPIKIGAVYQSATIPLMTRRVTRVRNGNVDYVMMRYGSQPKGTSSMTEEMFRQCTVHEIPTSKL